MCSSDLRRRISVEMPGPYVFDVRPKPFVRTDKPCYDPRRPPHPTPRVMTIAIRPSCRGGTTTYNHDFRKIESRLFLAGGLDRVSRVEIAGEFRLIERP